MFRVSTEALYTKRPLQEMSLDKIEEMFANAPSCVVSACDVEQRIGLADVCVSSNFVSSKRTCEIGASCSAASDKACRGI